MQNQHHTNNNYELHDCFAFISFPLLVHIAGQDAIVMRVCASGHRIVLEDDGLICGIATDDLVVGIVNTVDESCHDEIGAFHLVLNLLGDVRDRCHNRCLRRTNHDYFTVHEFAESIASICLRRSPKYKEGNRHRQDDRRGGHLKGKAEPLEANEDPVLEGDGEAIQHIHCEAGQSGVCDDGSDREHQEDHLPRANVLSALRSKRRKGYKDQSTETNERIHNPRQGSEV